MRYNYLRGILLSPFMDISDINQFDIFKDTLSNTPNLVFLIPNFFLLLLIIKQNFNHESIKYRNTGCKHPF